MTWFIVYGLVIRYGPQLVASATWLTSCVRMTCLARREFLLSKLQHFVSFRYTFKYNPGKTNNKFIYLVISYRRVRKRKRRFIVYGLVARYGPQSKLPAQVVKGFPFLFAARVSNVRSFHLLFFFFLSVLVSLAWHFSLSFGYLVFKLHALRARCCASLSH